MLLATYSFATPPTSTVPKTQILLAHACSYMYTHTKLPVSYLQLCLEGVNWCHTGVTHPLILMGGNLERLQWVGIARVCVYVWLAVISHKSSGAGKGDFNGWAMQEDVCEFMIKWSLFPLHSCCRISILIRSKRRHYRKNIKSSWPTMWFPTYWSLPTVLWVV